MKKNLVYIALFILGMFAMNLLSGIFSPKKEPEFKQEIQRFEEIQKKHYDTIKLILQERKAISRDSAIIIYRHEVLRNNLTNPIADSLARAIIKNFPTTKQGFD